MLPETAQHEKGKAFEIGENAPDSDEEQRELRRNNSRGKVTEFQIPPS